MSAKEPAKKIEIVKERSIHVQVVKILGNGNMKMQGSQQTYIFGLDPFLAHFDYSKLSIGDVLLF